MHVCGRWGGRVEKSVPDRQNEWFLYICPLKSIMQQLDFHIASYSIQRKTRAIIDKVGKGLREW